MYGSHCLNSYNCILNIIFWIKYICKFNIKQDFSVSLSPIDYGVDAADPSLVPRGPTFTQQPVDVVYDPEVFSNLQLKQVALECIADGNPTPTYSWYKVRTSVHVKLDPEVDERWVFYN